MTQRWGRSRRGIYKPAVFLGAMAGDDYDVRLPLTPHSLFFFFDPALLPASYADGDEIQSTAADVARINQQWDGPITEAAWNRMPWERPVLLTDSSGAGRHAFRIKIHAAEPGVSPKPTWAELVALLERWELDHTRAGFRAFNALEGYARESKQALASKPVPHTLTEQGIHVGDGLDHMPAMIYQASRSEMAGQPVERAVMKDSDGNHVDLWTRGERHELIGEQAARVNLLESARNIVEKRLAEMAAPWFDERGGLGKTATADEIHKARWASFIAVNDFLQPATIDAAMEAEVEKLKQAADLPADLARARALLVENLEAAAMARTKYVMKAATQQGIDRGFSCVDEERAVREIAEQCVLASIEVKRAETVAEAKTAYDAGAAAIEAVTVLNTPVWKIGGADYPANPATPVAVSGSTVKVEALHPAGQTIKGKVALKSSASKPVTVKTVKAGVASAHACEITIDAPVTGETVTLFLEAENLCGPSKMKVKLTP